MGKSKTTRKDGINPINKTQPLEQLEKMPKGAKKPKQTPR